MMNSCVAFRCSRSRRPAAATLAVAVVLVAAGLLPPAQRAAAQTSAAPARPLSPAQPPPAPQVRLAVELTRLDSSNSEAGAGTRQRPAAPPTARTIASPVLSALGRNSASVQVTGADLSYGVSLAPEVEQGSSAGGSDRDRLTLLWTLQLGGRSLPGATSVSAQGGGRIAAGRREPLTELTLRDPKTGRASVFRLYVTATTGDGLAAVLPAGTAATPPAKP